MFCVNVWLFIDVFWSTCIFDIPSEHMCLLLNLFYVCKEGSDYTFKWVMSCKNVPDDDDD